MTSYWQSGEARAASAAVRITVALLPMTSSVTYAALTRFAPASQTSSAHGSAARCDGSHSAILPGVQQIRCARRDSANADRLSKLAGYAARYQTLINYPPRSTPCGTPSRPLGVRRYRGNANGHSSSTSQSV